MTRQITYYKAVRITLLTLREDPITSIEGYVTQGNFTLDGKSAMRRTCSLTLVAKAADIQNYYWTYKSKFKIEIKYNGIWKPEGIYYITSFNSSQTLNQLTISISGKDKMAGLNGEMGGVFEAPIDVNHIEIEGELKDLAMQEIIYNLLVRYGQELPQNIFITDLPDGLELLEYRYDRPMYLYRPSTSSVITNLLFNEDTTCYLKDSDVSLTLGDLDYRHLEPLLNLTQESLGQDIYFTKGGTPCRVNKVKYGETVGFRETALVYPGELNASAGDSIVTILDKIVNVLGNYEYFYNELGQFIFQQKRGVQDVVEPPNHIKTDYPTFLDKYILLIDTASHLTQLSTTPQLDSIKNDFTIWGEREGIPIHLRFAIDEHPVSYTPIAISKEDAQILGLDPEKHVRDAGPTRSAGQVDWRELIYLMAKDFDAYGRLDTFYKKVGEANPQYPLGITGYEIYYTDILSFWRELYDPNIEETCDSLLAKLEAERPGSKNAMDLRAQLDELLRRHYNADTKTYSPWNQDIYNNPASLAFWFDLLESEKYSVRQIGRRPYIKTDTAINSLFFPATPDIIFIDDQTQSGNQTGYRYLQCDDRFFNISTQKKTAKETVDGLLEDMERKAESINLTMVPIYDLEINSLLRIDDDQTGIHGVYRVERINHTLAFNGMMQVTASKEKDLNNDLDIVQIGDTIKVYGTTAAIVQEDDVLIFGG